MTTTPAAAPTEASATLPANLRLTAAPTDAKGVAVAKAGAKDGQRIVVRGVVAGRAEPIAANRAILTLLWIRQSKHVTPTPAIPARRHGTPAVSLPMYWPRTA